MVTHGLAPRVLQSPVGPVVISDMTIGQIGLRDAHRWCIDITVEATAVVPEGRISPEDAALWTDSQVAPLKQIINFSHTLGAEIFGSCMQAVRHRRLQPGSS